MASAKITLTSFYTWFNTAVTPDDLFKNLTLPEGIDKDTLVGNILMCGGEFEVMYSDPYFLQNLIGIWSSKWYRTFDKWVKALAIEYNPLENYDRMEEWQDTRNNHGSETTSGSLGRTTSGSLSRTTSDSLSRRTSDSLSRTATDGGTTETKVSAYDSSTYQPSQQVTATNSSGYTDTGSGTLSDTGSGSLSDTESGTLNDTTSGSTTTSFGEGAKHEGRIHGNVGVTTSQTMLESELQIAEWNLYEHITDLFLSEFVIPIYS